MVWINGSTELIDKQLTHHNTDNAMKSTAPG